MQAKGEEMAGGSNVTHKNGISVLITKILMLRYTNKLEEE